jgi:thioredoxin-dependent peroxiredoxin
LIVGFLVTSAKFPIRSVSLDAPFVKSRVMSIALAIRRRIHYALLHYQSLSSHRSSRFEREYGVLVKEWRLFQRVVFVVDKDDRFVH